MNKLNKKGFTLIELMAVVIILIVVIFIAMRIIGDNVKDTETKAMIANAGSYIKAVNNFMEVESIGNVSYKNNIFTVNELEQLGVNLSGTKPDSGILTIRERQVYSGCLVYGDYHVNYANQNVEDPQKGPCADDAVSFSFDYTGNEQVFTVPMSGVYKIEAWGAQGGDSVNNAAAGGYGGYSSTKVYLIRGNKLYINVGEQGAIVTGGSSTTSYNGGASCKTDASPRTCGNGGGATSVALASGTLDNVLVDSLLLVAGGGGGAATHASDTSTAGGAGGGYLAVSGSSAKWSGGAGGTQSYGGAGGSSSGDTQAGSYGKGGNGAVNAGAGGGGGFYGGGGGHGGSAGGGSGFIGNYKTSDGIMYCYNCSQTNVPYLNTKETTCSKLTAEKECSKKGNGYVKLSLVSEVNNLENKKFLYSVGNEFTGVTGGWVAENFQTNGRTEKLASSLYIYCSSTGNSGSRFTTTNAIDMTGYTKLNVVYEIVSQLVTSDYGKLAIYGDDLAAFTKGSTTAAGYYLQTVDVSSLTSSHVTISNDDGNMRIYQVWLSN